MNKTDPPPLPTPDVSLMQETQYKVYDSLIATGLCICFLIGLPGNCLAFSYFLQTKKRNLSTLLYIAASTIDIGSSVFHFPVTINWFNRRDPGLLNNKNFCSIWYFTLILCQILSMFVVMLLSVSRTIVILFPFYKIRRGAIFISVVIYLLYVLTWDTMKIFVYGKYYYSHGFGYCAFYSDKTEQTYHTINYTACTGIPTIIVLVTLVVSVFKLRGRNLTRESGKKKRQSSLTIIYFTSIFLVCNSLTFINRALYIPTQVSDKLDYPGQIYKNKFMFFYSWLISEIFCTVLNASLNPILYFWRMKRMRVWATRVFNIRIRDEINVTVLVNPTPTANVTEVRETST